MMLINELQKYQKNRIDNPSSLVYKYFVEDILADLEADAVETLSESSMVTSSSSGPTVHSHQRHWAEISQNEFPVSALDAMVEDANSQARGKHGHCSSKRAADDAAKKKLIDNESTRPTNLLHSSMR